MIDITRPRAWKGLDGLGEHLQAIHSCLCMCFVLCALCFVHVLCAFGCVLCALCCVLCVLCFVLGALSAFCFLLMLCALWTVPVCDLNCEVWLWLCHTVAPHPIMFHVSINMTWFPGLVYSMPHPHKFVITQSLHQDLVSRACCCSTSPHLMCLSVYHMPTHCWTYPEILD